MEKYLSASIVFTITFRPYKQQQLEKQHWYVNTVQEALRQFKAEHPLADLVQVSRQYL